MEISKVDIQGKGIKGVWANGKNYKKFCEEVKMNTLKKIGFVITGLCAAVFLAAFFLSCVTTTVVPEGCENSVIYRLLPNPSQTGILLKLGNLAAIDADIYTPQQAIDVINETRLVLNSYDTTYAILAMFVSDRVGPYIMILGDLVPDFKLYDIPINQCDLDILNKHLDEQEMICRMRFAQHVEEYHG